MMTALDKINIIKQKQRTVDSLLETGILAKDEAHFENEDRSIDVDILYQKDATIGLGTVKYRGEMQEHTHETSKHYLICVTGIFVIKFQGLLRVLNPGDCLSLGPGVPHTTQCLREGKLIFINVPADESWS